MTGASTGIGRAVVDQLVKRGMVAIPTVRTAADGAEWSARHGEQVWPVVFDVTDGDAVRAAALDVADRLSGQHLAGLVNNAGIAVAGPLQMLPIDELRWQLEVNVVGQLAVSQAFLPLLGATERSASGAPGRIVMISSLSGRLADPFLGPYAASKHALEAIAQSLRRELMAFGIRVVVVAPGAVKTPIWDKAAALDFSEYATSRYGPAIERFRGELIGESQTGCEPSSVANVVVRSLVVRRPRRRYTVFSHRHSYNRYLHHVPPAVLDYLYGRALGLRLPRRKIRLEAEPDMHMAGPDEGLRAE